MTTDREICLSFDEDLSALRDGALSQEREAEVEAHLAGCAPCRARLASFAAVDEGLRGLVSRPVAPNLEARLFARLEAERAAAAERAAPAAGRSDGRGLARAARGERSLPRRRPRKALALVAMLTTVAAALAVYLGVLRSPGPLEPSAGVRPPGIVAVQERPASQPGSALEAASEEELSVAIELETLEDLEVIANLELLEQLDARGEKDNG